jgi:hypothetical protein
MKKLNIIHRLKELGNLKCFFDLTKKIGHVQTNRSTNYALVPERANADATSPHFW